ncbi:MAG: magnesium transporter [Bacteroidales bacterium]|nr:magnesium transporter [Coprobacter sp.]MBR4119292.1 magnesium transporter [Bacteroidales bacterium]
MIELSPEYIKDLQNIIEEKDTDKIKALLKDLHPADIAEIYKELSLEEAEFTYNLLEPEIAAEVLMELEEDDRQKLLKHVSNEEIAHQVIEQLDTDDAVDLIREMDEEDQEEILAHIDDVEQAGDIVDLLKYDEDTAGGLMGTEMVIVNENWSMPECLKEMRQQAEEMDEIYYVYVVDDDHKLKGVFPLKKIITHQSVAKIKHVMKREPISLHTDTPIDEVAQAFEKYNLVAMPVVDSIGRLVGRITVDDIMDEVREQSEREYQLASGISQDVEVDDNVFTQTRARLPWLVIGIFGGLLNSIMLGGFEAGLAAVPAIALFIPLIAGTAGNVGVQSSAIIVQGLANGSLDLRNVGTQILKEVGVSLINASIIALLTFAFNMLIGTEADITVAVSISLFAVVIFASIFGTLVPITLEKFKIDPAIATGPFITTTNDIVGLLIYMLCCTLMLA